MTFIFKLLSELSVIVNLAIKRKPHGLVFVCHRLLSCGEIDNAQPLMPESDAHAVGVRGHLTLVVRPAVREGPPHALHYFALDFSPLSYVSVNPAHRVLEKLSSLRCQMICDDVQPLSIRNQKQAVVFEQDFRRMRHFMLQVP